jgi:hypothetical protein
LGNPSGQRLFDFWNPQLLFVGCKQPNFIAPKIGGTPQCLDANPSEGLSSEASTVLGTKKKATENGKDFRLPSLKKQHLLKAFWK